MLLEALHLEVTLLHRDEGVDHGGDSGACRDTRDASAHRGGADL